MGDTRTQEARRVGTGIGSGNKVNPVRRSNYRLFSSATGEILGSSLFPHALRYELKPLSHL